MIEDPINVDFLLDYAELAAALHQITGKTLDKTQIDLFLSQDQELFLEVFERGLDVPEVRAAFERAAIDHFKEPQA